MDAILQVHRQQQNLHKDAAWEAEHLSGTQGSVMGGGHATNTHSPLCAGSAQQGQKTMSFSLTLHLSF